MFWKWLLCLLAATPEAQMRTVQVDAAMVTGSIRSLQGVNGPPINPLRDAWDVSKQYRDLRIDLVRTHDFFGPADIDAQWPDPDMIARAMKADGSKSIYSWHHYTHVSADPYELAQIVATGARHAGRQRFPKAENHVTEWNMSLTNDAAHQSSEHAAFCGAALTYLQDAALDRSLYYRADPNVIGLFDPDGSYRKKAYTFKALGAMLDTRQRLASSGGDTLGFAILAGRSEDGKTVEVLISNYEIPEAARKPRTASGGFGKIEPRQDFHYDNDAGYALKVSHLPWGSGAFTVKRYRITKTDNWTESESSGKGGTLEMTNPLPAPGVELIVIRRK